MGGSDLGGDLSCQIFHADKNLVDEQNRGMIHILPPPGCAAALTQPSTQQVKLSLGSTQAFYIVESTIWRTVEKVKAETEVEVEGVEAANSKLRQSASKFLRQGKGGGEYEV